MPQTVSNDSSSYNRPGFGTDIDLAEQEFVLGIASPLAERGAATCPVWRETQPNDYTSYRYTQMLSYRYIQMLALKGTLDGDGLLYEIKGIWATV